MSSRVTSLFARLRAARRCGFVRDESGATLIEFAILGIPFFGIVGAILETSVMMLSSQVLDSAVYDASRFIRTGQAQSAHFDEARFKREICDRTYGLFGDCSGLKVKVSQINDFGSSTVPSPVEAECEDTCDWTIDEGFSPGGGSNIILVQAYYKWPVILGFNGSGLANQPDNTRLIATVRVFRNEPF